MFNNDYMIEKHLAVAYFGQSKELVEENHLLNRVLLGEIVDKGD